MSIAIVIPARYGSTRFPGKPLARIGDKTMLQRVVELANETTHRHSGIHVCVATEDKRIQDHCHDLNISCHITDNTCETGTDRVAQTVNILQKAGHQPNFVINIQGDTPFTPPAVLNAIIETYQKKPDSQVITPVHKLSWADLDRLRNDKKTTPFSGTTAILNSEYKALWFSKNIIPAIRKESDLRDISTDSPVWQHIGIYGYNCETLQKFVNLPVSTYEKLEGLEQLRLIENNIPIQCVPVNIVAGSMQSGIDSPEDLERANRHIQHT